MGSFTTRLSRYNEDSLLPVTCNILFKIKKLNIVETHIFNNTTIVICIIKLIFFHYFHFLWVYLIVTFVSSRWRFFYCVDRACKILIVPSCSLYSSIMYTHADSSPYSKLRISIIHEYNGLSGMKGVLESSIPAYESINNIHHKYFQDYNWNVLKMKPWINYNHWTMACAILLIIKEMYSTNCVKICFFMNVVYVRTERTVFSQREVYYWGT